MNRIIGFTLLCCSLTNAFPFPFPATPTGRPVTTLPTAIPFATAPTPIPFPTSPTGLPISPVPTPFPFAPNTRPIAPGFNNPYYNYAGAPAVPILSYSSEHGLDGNYAFSFSTADGKQAQESGFLKDAFIDNNGEPQGTQVVQGSYAYVSPDGTPIQVSYIADEHGFRPSGVHIPADGKAIAPLLEKNNKQIFDPAYNHYNPHLNNPYLNRERFLGQYNNGRPYDPRYPYDPARVNPYYNNYDPYNQSYNYNKNYNPHLIAPQAIPKDAVKKGSA